MNFKETLDKVLQKEVSLLQVSNNGHINDYHVHDNVSKRNYKKQLTKEIKSL